MPSMTYLMLFSKPCEQFWPLESQPALPLKRLNAS
jgi:hypothetical protein